MKNVSRIQQKRKKQSRISDALLFFISMSLPIVCACLVGFISYQTGSLDTFLFSNHLTRTAIAENDASCQLIIQKAMETSGNYCNQIDSNKACYGNNTLKTELVPNSVVQFNQRGDIVTIDQIQRIVASPLKPETNEWGIAVLKVFANLPRSLPGQTITFIVFGNTTLDNEEGNLDSFFFSSELGKIQCQKVPEDGIMITVPDGEGITFNVNGAEITLTGNASITAHQNGEMEVNLYEGLGLIVSDGQEEYFGAGQQVSVPLGGENGTEAVGPISAPVPISQNDLNTACLLTGQYCYLDEITLISNDEAEEALQELLGITPTILPAISHTAINQSTLTSTPTLWILASRTSTITRTITPGGPTLTATRTPTRTITSTRTPTITPGGPTLTPTPTRTPTSTITSTSIPSPTNIAIPTNTAIAATNTAIPTNTPDVCSQISVGSLSSPNTNELNIMITNSSGSSIRLDTFSMNWIDTPSSQRVIKVRFGGVDVWNGNENNDPGNWPSEHPWDGPATNRDIAPSTVSELFMQFDELMATGTYTINFTFDNGCNFGDNIVIP